MRRRRPRLPAVARPPAPACMPIVVVTQLPGTGRAGAPLAAGAGWAAVVQAKAEGVKQGGILMMIPRPRRRETGDFSWPNPSLNKQMNKAIYNLVWK